MEKFRETQNIQEASDADTNYNQAIKEIESMLKTIQKQVTAHQKKQKKEPNNWGFVGDLDGVESALVDAIKSMK